MGKFEADPATSRVMINDELAILGQVFQE
jgi:hypothetical protein